MHWLTKKEHLAIADKLSIVDANLAIMECDGKYYKENFPRVYGPFNSIEDVKDRFPSLPIFNR